MVKPLETLLEPGEVKQFFPANFADLLGLPEHAINYFGTYQEETGEKGGISVTYYLVPNIKRSSLRGELRILSLKVSDEPLIRGSAISYYEETVRDNPSLQDTVPLLIVRLRGDLFQFESNPNRFIEIHRYADHLRFRRRGLATAVLESISNKMRSKGTEYVYVSFPPERWPSSSKVIPALYASQELKSQIDSCFCPNSGHPGFGRGLYRGFIIITDKASHQVEYENAMQNKRRLDGYSSGIFS